jgi:hypothetical protein
MTKFVSNLLNDNEVTDKIYLARMRYWRDGELARTDWTQVADAPVDQAAWATYRQELRDIPQQSGYPFNVIWPTSPQG